MLLSLARERRVLVVGGKGGVGKTSVASAVALAEARRGRPVVLASSDPAHNLGHLWLRDVGDEGVEVAPGLTAVEIDPAATTRAHLATVRATMRRLLPEHLHGQADRHLDLAREAPGMHEAAVLERVAELVVRATADDDVLVVLDTAPSGHTARLLALPRALGTWTDALLAGRDRRDRLDAALRSVDPEDDEPGGLPPDRADELRAVLVRRRERFEAMHHLLSDADRTAFVLVTTPERLPVVESLELHARLGELGIAVGAVVVNRRSGRAREDAHVAHLTAALPAVPVVEVPTLDEDVVGPDGVAHLARALDAARVRAD